MKFTLRSLFGRRSNAALDDASGETIAVVGLGNPGREYENTRHNVGFWLVDCLAERLGVEWALKREFEAFLAQGRRGGRRVLLARPRTYVNLSGRSVGEICRYYRLQPSSVIIVYDDLNIELGRIKISDGGSAGGHNGLESLIQRIGPSFARFRIGIGPKQPREMDMKDFVLGRFTEEQWAALRARKEEFLEGLMLLIDSGAKSAMNRVNRQNRNQNERNEQEFQG